VAALEGQGVRKLVVLNGHGGNDFRQIIRELVPRTRVLLCAVNWWQVETARRTSTTWATTPGSSRRA
jgi:creatinine amidohydrolase